MDILSALRFVLLGSCLAILAGGGALFLAQWRKRAEGAPVEEAPVFLFRDSQLIDMTPAAQSLLAGAGRQGRDMAAVTSLLALQFPDLPQTLGSHATTAQLRDAAGAVLKLMRWDRFTRLTLGLGQSAAQTGGDAILGAELAALRAIAEDAPQLIWKEDPDGRLTWANRAYLDRATIGDDAQWPDNLLFADLPRPAADGTSTKARAGLAKDLGSGSGPGSGTARSHWFEVTLVRRAGQIMGFAVDATGAVAAEDRSQTLLQTLTKTFAHLSSGLAIFDRHRRLVLFNPAFIDLTGLRVDFLAQRPLVHSVLDRLHDMQMLPEPRHYASWREQLAALEAAAEEGSYSETWMLPNGATYRVSGRPHPDGALAFLFEDISDETALSRQFRAGQEAGQAILDLLPQAVAAFSRGGVMILHNAAYDRLWQRDTASAGLAPPHLAQEIARWRRGSMDTAGWDRLAQGLTPGDRLDAPVTTELRTGEGCWLRLQITPLPGGVRQIEFRLRDPVERVEALPEPLMPEPRLPETLLPETLLPETLLPETLLPEALLPAAPQPAKLQARPLRNAKRAESA